jgi:uncharacterized protein
MKKIILTFCLTLSLATLVVSVGAQAPTNNRIQKAVKPVSSSLPDFIAAEEIQFKGDGVILSGTLFLPKSKAGQKVPAILMVSDFYSLRDGVKVHKGMHTTYTDLATHFVRRGFAVLRYDRRCTGASECGASGTMAVAADDGVGAVHYLRERKEIDPNKIIVFGHGDGSYIAAGIAGHKEVAGLIATVAPGRNASKLLRDWAQTRVQDRKLSAAESEKYLENLEVVIQRLAAGGAKTEEFKLDAQDEFLTPLVKTPDYAYSWLLDDPLGLYPLVKGSVLVVHGGKDRKVTPKEGNYINDALQTADHKDYETLLLPEMDYYLKVNKGAASFEADNDISRPLDPALLKLLDEWLAKKLK